MTSGGNSFNDFSENQLINFVQLTLKCIKEWNAHFWFTARFFTTVKLSGVKNMLILYSLRSFGVAGPRLWNSLPAELRQQDFCLTEFRQLLKTFLFR